MAFERGLVARKSSVETNRDFRQVADALGLTPAKLKRIIDGKKVMDMGSGPGRFAVEVEVQKRRGLLGPATEIYSLNERYSFPDYPFEWLNRGGREIIEQYGGDPELLRSALSALKERALPYNWHDLSALVESGKRFDVIISSYAFPYYSDLRAVTADTSDELEAMQAGKLPTIIFGPASKKVFAQLAKLLTDGGVCVFTTEIPMWSFHYATEKFKQSFFEFFESIGFEASFSQKSKYHALHLTLKRKPTKAK